MSSAIAVRVDSSLPTAAEWSTITAMGAALVKSGLLPAGIKTPEAAAAVILKGRELGIPPMQAFSHIAVISGKPACSAELHLALLARGGATWEWLRDGSDGVAEIAIHRPGWPRPISGRFSMDDAKKAGVTSNPTWSKYPANMLRARAITNAARMAAPDLLAGMSYTPEELGAEVDEDGHVLSGPPEPAQAVAEAPAPALEPTVVREAQQPAEAEWEDVIDWGAPAPEAAEVVADIQRAEAGLGLNPAHIRGARKKYAGAEELSSASLEGLRRYRTRLEEYANSVEGGEAHEEAQQ